MQVLHQAATILLYLGAASSRSKAHADPADAILGQGIPAAHSVLYWSSTCLPLAFNNNTCISEACHVYCRSPQDTSLVSSDQCRFWHLVSSSKGAWRPRVHAANSWHWRRRVCTSRLQLPGRAAASSSKVGVAFWALLCHAPGLWQDCYG